MEKRVYRNRDNKVFAGVLGGLGEYLDIDPVLLRVIWLAITVFTGLVPGIVVYVLAIFVIPLKPRAIPMKAAETADSPETSNSKET